MSRTQMIRALERLGEILETRGIKGNVYVVGKAAMVLAYGSEEVTRDIDASIEPYEEAFAAVRQVTQELTLNEEWLNDTAIAFMPSVRAGEGAVVLDKPGISVRSAPAEVVFVMKLLAARDKDVDDILFLAQLLDIRTGQQAFELFDHFYPPSTFGDAQLLLQEERARALRFIEDAFGPFEIPSAVVDELM